MLLGAMYYFSFKLMADFCFLLWGLMGMMVGVCMYLCRNAYVVVVLLWKAWISIIIVGDSCLLGSLFLDVVMISLPLCLNSMKKFGPPQEKKSNLGP